MSGYRTYIVALLAVILAAVHQLGYLDDHTFQTLLGLLAGTGMATIRAAIGNTVVLPA